MKPSEVLFVAGDVDRLASIKIRCREIAARLGCDCHYNAKTVAEVPAGYKGYVCVKPDFPRTSLTGFARKGLVVWDILDDTPPTEGVDAYIASTIFVRALFERRLRKPIEVIPHYHCNFTGQLNDGTRRIAAYVGSDHWYPLLDGVDHRKYFVHRWNREQLVNLYLEIGISINLRNLSIEGEKWVQTPTDITPVPVKHIMLNSGIKLINCLGFGIPSVSSVEPAYMEIAPECTIFTDQLTCREHLRELAENNELYTDMRARCISEARRFSVEAVVDRYRDLIRSL